MPQTLALTPHPSPTKPANTTTAMLHWRESGQACSALWRSERGMPPPQRVRIADDTLNADAAYKLACEGTALLWRGDFQNARQLLLALARRAERPIARKKKGPGSTAKATAADGSAAPATATVAASLPGQAFHLHRQAQSQRARVLGMLLVQFEPDYSVSLRRAPDVRQACAQAWGSVSAAALAAAEAPQSSGERGSVTSLRELLGVVSAHEWRKKGVEVPALGPTPGNRIHPHYGVFSPLRGEYVALVAQAPLPAAFAQADSRAQAFDIGTGTGVLAAVLARRGLQHIVATEQDPRALACAQDNLQRLGLGKRVHLLKANLFPPAEQGLAALLLCNPPWIPARAGSPIERAVYDEGSQMLLGFLNGAAQRLAPGGEVWLILSNIAELLGLRTRAELLGHIEAAGLKLLARIDTKPEHAKVHDASDTLHSARAAELTSLWRLVASNP